MMLRGRRHSRTYDGSLSPITLGVLLVVVGIVVAFTLRVRHSKNPETPAKLAAAHRADGNPAATRKVFPFSVIHGGAYSKEELARARRTDAVVAAHYVGFGTSPEFHKLSHDTLLYVSYRRGNQVYWSNTRHLVRQGETVISDGNCMARARCGNRLSATPQGPIAPKEPGEEILNTPEIPEELGSYKLADLPGPAGRTFQFNLPSSFGGDSPAPVALSQARTGGGLPGSSAPGTYFASGPGGTGGGSGPATTSANAAKTATAASTPTTLPVTTTGGSSLPVSSGFPVTGPPSGGIPSNTPAELVPEPVAFGYFVLVGSLTVLWSLGRFRSSILRG